MLPRGGRLGIYQKTTINMEYEYYLLDGHPGDGVFNNLPMRVDTTTLVNDPDPDKEMYGRLLHVKHESMLECFCIDYTNKNIVYEYFSNHLKDMTSQPLLTYEVPKRYSGMPIQYNYICEKYRTIFREMVRFVCYIHRLNFCLKSLSLENLMLSDGKLKFYGLSLLLKNDQREVEDFKHVAKVITSLLQHKGCGTNQIPANFKKFLECLRQFKILGPNNPNNITVTKQQQEHFLQNHIAILHSEERIARIECYGTRMHSFTYDLEIAVTAMGVQTGWMKNFQSFLWGPLRDVLVYSDSYDDESVDYQNSFVWFGRNLCNHLEKYMRHYKQSYTSMGVELTIMAAMGAEIAAFVRCLQPRRVP